MPLLSLSAFAQPADLRTGLDQLETLRLKIQDAPADATSPTGDPGLSAREQWIDQAIELRRGLIAQSPAESAERLKMTYEQCASLLARLARDGADTSVLVGLPEDERREAVRVATDEVSALLEPLPRDKAPIRELLLRGRMSLLQARLDPASPLSKQAARRAALAFRDAERAGQGQLAQMQGGDATEFESFARTGMALAILFDASRDASKGALQLLQDLAPQPHPTELEVHAARLLARLAQATALPARSTGTPTPSQPPPPPTPEARRQAIIDALAEFDRALEKPKASDPPATSTEPAQEHLTLAPGQALSPLERVLWIEVGARALLEAWRSSEDPSLLALAGDRLSGLIDMDTLGLTPAERLALAKRLMGTLLEQASNSAIEITPDALPPLALFVWAERSTTSDPSLAARLFESILDPAKTPTKDSKSQANAPIPAGLVVEALWQRSILPGTPDESALRWLMRLAREHPDSSRAPQAAALAIERAMSNAALNAPIPNPAREALVLAVTRFPEAEPITRWRLLLARALGEQGDWKGALAQLDRVKSTAPEAPRVPDAIVAIAIARLDAHAAALRDAYAADDLAKARSIAGQEMLPIATRARDALVARVKPGDSRLIRLQAEAGLAMVESGEGDARQWLESLLMESAKVPGGATRLKLALARARLAFDDDREKGFAELKALAAELDGRGDRSEAFWHAWTLILETASAERTDTDVAGSIRANIAKLRTIDRGLGGEPWNRRIERVLDGLDK
jgi:hypothetical protein